MHGQLQMERTASLRYDDGYGPLKGRSSRELLPRDQALHQGMVIYFFNRELFPKSRGTSATPPKWLIADYPSVTMKVCNAPI